MGLWPPPSVGCPFQARNRFYPAGSKLFDICRPLLELPIGVFLAMFAGQAMKTETGGLSHFDDKARDFERRNDASNDILRSEHFNHFIPIPAFVVAPG